MLCENMLFSESTVASAAMNVSGTIMAAAGSIKESFNGVVQLLTVLLLFVFVLAITLFSTKWIANYEKGKAVGTNIEVMETCRITVNKYVQIVRMGEKYVAIGIGKDEITFLCELEEGDLQLSRPESAPMPDFKSILEKIKNSKKK